MKFYLQSITRGVEKHLTTSGEWKQPTENDSGLASVAVFDDYEIASGALGSLDVSASIRVFSYTDEPFVVVRTENNKVEYEAEDAYTSDRHDESILCFETYTDAEDHINRNHKQNQHLFSVGYRDITPFSHGDEYAIMFEGMRVYSGTTLHPTMHRIRGEHSEIVTFNELGSAISKLAEIGSEMSGRVVKLANYPFVLVNKDGLLWSSTKGPVSTMLDCMDRFQTARDAEIAKYESGIPQDLNVILWFYEFAELETPEKQNSKLKSRERYYIRAAGIPDYTESDIDTSEHYVLNDGWVTTHAFATNTMMLKIGAVSEEFKDAKTKIYMNESFVRVVDEFDPVVCMSFSTLQRASCYATEKLKGVRYKIEKVNTVYDDQTVTVTKSKRILIKHGDAFLSGVYLNDDGVIIPEYTEQYSKTRFFDTHERAINVVKAITNKPHKIVGDTVQF